MKRVLPFALAALLLLSACRAPAADSPAPVNPPSPAVTDGGNPDGRYLFYEGFFLGCYDGAWRSAAEGGFSLSEVFCRAYLDPWGEELHAVRFFAGDGPGAFYDAEKARAALEPNGILEGEDFIMKLPAALTPAAAVLPIPDYNFFAQFDGQTYQLISNARLSIPYMTPADGPGEEAVLRALEGCGIHADPDWMDVSAWEADLDGDGAAELLTLCRNKEDEDTGFLSLPEGGQIFYALLLTKGGETSAVTFHAIDYTDDVTAYFTPGNPLAADLDGDGRCELLLQEGCWEWGYYYVFSPDGGAWHQVMSAEYGV